MMNNLTPILIAVAAIETKEGKNMHIIVITSWLMAVLPIAFGDINITTELGVMLIYACFLFIGLPILLFPAIISLFFVVDCIFYLLMGSSVESAKMMMSGIKTDFLFYVSLSGIIIFTISIIICNLSRPRNGRHSGHSHYLD